MVFLSTFCCQLRHAGKLQNGRMLTVFVSSWNSRSLSHVQRLKQINVWHTVSKHQDTLPNISQATGFPHSLSHLPRFFSNNQHISTTSDGFEGKLPVDESEESGNTEIFIQVDKAGLSQVPDHSHGKVEVKEEETAIGKHLKALIQFRNGPITVAEYMEEVLTNPVAGFYMNRDVFGQGGDFVTSPDVSQMFGEMMGVWAVSVFQQMGSPQKVQVVELGPGRGTLMADLLRGTSKFVDFYSAAEVHLVEVSPALREIQWKTLNCQSEPNSRTESKEEETLAGMESAGKVPKGVCGGSGPIVRWHLDLESVPRGVPTIIVAHEFFDALPVHQFQRTERGWREKLIDVADNDSPHHFRFVLSPGPTAASALFLQRRLDYAPSGAATQVQQVEVCPWGQRVAAEMASRLATDGGAALVIDYGEEGIVEDSLQAIRKHKFVHVLETPGSADLSAYVDFTALKMATEKIGGVEVFGPVNQNKLLWSLGINFRLEALLANADSRQSRDLRMGYWRLMGDGEATWDEEEEEGNGEAPPGMGVRYKAMAVVSKGMGRPAGFE